jgi:hypothetical protein
VVDTVATSESFDGWYRIEHPRLLGLLTVVAGDPDVAREITSEAFVRSRSSGPDRALLASTPGWSTEEECRRRSAATAGPSS